MPIFLEEVVREALKGAEEEEIVEPEACNDDDDASSDENFGFNNKSSSHKKAPPKAKAKAATKVGSGNDAEVQMKPAQSEQASDSKPDKQDKLFEKMDALIVFLEGFNALSFWQGALKAKEWEGKVEKALQLASTLETLVNPDAGKSLQTRAEKIFSYMEDLSALRNIPSSMISCEIFAMEDAIVERLTAFSSDCLAAVLTDCGKKFLEDGASRHHSVSTGSACSEIDVNDMTDCIIIYCNVIVSQSEHLFKHVGCCSVES